MQNVTSQLLASLSNQIIAVTDQVADMEKKLESITNERNRWMNVSKRLNNALRAANNFFHGDSYSQRVIDEALTAFRLTESNTTTKP